MTVGFACLGQSVKPIELALLPEVAKRAFSAMPISKLAMAVVMAALFF